MSLLFTTGIFLARAMRYLIFKRKSEQRKSNFFKLLFGKADIALYVLQSGTTTKIVTIFSGESTRGTGGHVPRKNTP
jgi:hypothetical protein